MLNTIIILIILAAAGGGLWWLYRAGRADLAVDIGEWAGQLWDRVRDWRHAGHGEPEPATADGPLPAADGGLPAETRQPWPRPLPPPPAPDPEQRPPAETATPDMPVGTAQGDLLYSVHALVTMAARGDLLTVRRVMSTLAVASEGIGSAVVALARRLSEPDKDYGPEVWEPAHAAGAQITAAGMLFLQSDGLLVSLINSTMGEVAASQRRAPHSSQLNGGNQ